VKLSLFFFSRSKASYAFSVTEIVLVAIPMYVYTCTKKTLLNKQRLMAAIKIVGVVLAQDEIVYLP
jgi:hypothetical protein